MANKYFPIQIKLLLSVSIILIIYGCFCRWFNIYFFWESTCVGFILLLITSIFFCINSIKYKRKNDSHSVLEKIIIGILSFTLLIISFFLFIQNKLSVYTELKNYIVNNQQIVKELGKINHVTILPYGGMSQSSSADGIEGNGNVYLIVKGDKKYKDFQFVCTKEKTSNWQFIKE